MVNIYSLGQDIPAISGMTQPDIGVLNDLRGVNFVAFTSDASGSLRNLS